MIASLVALASRGLLSPWLRWGAILALAAAIYGTGRLHQARADQAAQIAREHATLVAQIARTARRAAVTQAIATDYERDRERVRIVHETIVREVAHVVDRPVYRDCRLDADGVRLVTAALAGTTDPAPGEPAGPMPAAAHTP